MNNKIKGLLSGFGIAFGIMFVFGFFTFGFIRNIGDFVLPISFLGAIIGFIIGCVDDSKKKESEERIMNIKNTPFFKSILEIDRILIHEKVDEAARNLIVDRHTRPQAESCCNDSMSMLTAGESIVIQNIAEAGYQDMTHEQFVNFMEALGTAPGYEPTYSTYGSRIKLNRMYWTRNIQPILDARYQQACKKYENEQRQKKKLF